MGKIGAREVIRRLGEATSVTRVLLVDNRAPNLGGQIGDTCYYEWAIPFLPAEEQLGGSVHYRNQNGFLCETVIPNAKA